MVRTVWLLDNARSAWSIVSTDRTIIRRSPGQSARIRVLGK
jgi:hypothetical protein